MLRKPSTREGLACALFSEKGIESRKASGRSKVEHPFLTSPKASKCATQRADIGRVRKVV
ncbi:hypothetical protein [Atopobium sp. oral taxon 416]|uniref:hypothetical protein n=1 Tax=Atopobium sp. oral taxon 416 TaxID=712157 RepID=UPI001BAD848F|nr:hypothetical protein [Atopobium sp. oral taxon 416]QUC04329.1 hypothetical protein J4859_05185 [Atopobium sp. oral taxon 416]